MLSDSAAGRARRVGFRWDERQRLTSPPEDVEIERTGTPRPTLLDLEETATVTDVILVHGAWSDASVWHPVMARLWGDGHEPTAVGLPMTTLDQDIAWTRRELAGRDRPTILVGHSYGGMVISAAALDQPHVMGLVFVCAYAPGTTDTVATLSGQGREMPGRKAIRFSSDGWTSLTPQGFVDSLASDLPSDTAYVLAASQRATHSDCLTGAPGAVAWAGIPCRYIQTLDDHMFDPELQRWFAERVNAERVELPAGHLVPLSRPDDVAAVIRSMAAEFG